MIEKVKIGNEDAFRTREGKLYYSRIVGGLAWPFGEKPGFLVVIAEDFKEDSALNARPLRVLAEREALDLEEMARRYQELLEAFKAAPWIGDPKNTPLMHYFRARVPGFSLSYAPHYDDPHNLQGYAQLVRTLCAENRKILHIGDHDRIRGNLAALPTGDLKNPAAEFPPLAALGYAVAHLFYNKKVRVRTVTEMMEIFCLNHGRV